MACFFTVKPHIFNHVNCLETLYSWVYNVAIVKLKRFEINVGKGYGPVGSELALNGNFFVEVKGLTGAVS